MRILGPIVLPSLTFMAAFNRPRRVRKPSRRLGQIDDGCAVGSPQQVDHRRPRRSELTMSYGTNTTRRASSACVHALSISASGTARVATCKPAGFAAANTARIAATNRGPGTLPSPLPIISIGVERSTSARSVICPPVTAPICTKRIGADFGAAFGGGGEPNARRGERPRLIVVRAPPGGYVTLSAGRPITSNRGHSQRPRPCDPGLPSRASRGGSYQPDRRQHEPRRIATPRARLRARVTL